MIDLNKLTNKEHATNVNRVNRLINIAARNQQLTPQQRKTLKGQVRAGDWQAAEKGLRTIAERGQA